jgi:flagellar biogenesis protein FliO
MARWLLSLILALLAMPAAARAAEPATQPAAVEGPISAYEAIAIRSNRTPDAAAALNRPTSAARTNSDSSFGMTRVMFSLSIVLAAIFGLKWAGNKFFGLPRGGNSGEVIQVLARSMVAPRQQLMLVQVGRRVLLVANSGAQMNCLSEIKDAEEVAELVGQLGRKSSPPSAFSSIIGRAGAQFKDAQSESEPEVAETEETLPDPALATTREEIGGLMQKVRALSRAYGK